MRVSIKLFCCFLLAGCNLFADNKESLFKYNGKSYNVENLPPALKQSYFDIESQRFDALNQIIDQAILEEYVATKAKKDKKPEDQVRNELFGTKPVSEADAKKWFEENKARLGGREIGRAHV